MSKENKNVEVLYIAVIREDLNEFGIDQDSEYVKLYYNPNDLMGFWINVDDDNIPHEICVYIGAQKFFIRYTEQDKAKLLSILNNK